MASLQAICHTDRARATLLWHSTHHTTHSTWRYQKVPLIFIALADFLHSSDDTFYFFLSCRYAKSKRKKSRPYHQGVRKFSTFTVSVFPVPAGPSGLPPRFKYIAVVSVSTQRSVNGVTTSLPLFPLGHAIAHGRTTRRAT